MWFEAMHPGWQAALSDWRGSLDELEAILKEPGEAITPDAGQVMRAFETPPEAVRVLLLGQDPYPSPGVANGLAFAANHGAKLPASLRNISRELQSDLGHALADQTLEHWRGQGVFLFNASLTTRSGAAGAHGRLWSPFCSAVLQHLDGRPEPPVALLLGNWAAMRAEPMTRATKVFAAHPSPLSSHRGFFGSRPFSRVNQALVALGRQEIDW